MPTHELAGLLYSLGTAWHAPVAYQLQCSPVHVPRVPLDLPAAHRDLGAAVEADPGLLTRWIAGGSLGHITRMCILPFVVLPEPM